MKRPEKLFLTLCMLLTFLVQVNFLSAQTKPQRKDRDRDTSDIYKKIKKYSDKHKFTKFIYKGIFRNPPNPVAPSKSNDKSLSNKQKKIDPNARYVGKIIRSIEVIVYDPFGHTVNDTLIREIDSWQKAGNKLHLTTRNIIIRNLLLFRKNDKVDILKITESERIMRQAAYVNDARIFLKGGNKEQDSVDIRVVVQDRWSWEVEALVNSPTDLSLSFIDQNLIGLGQQFQQSYSHDFKNNLSNYSSRHNITNIRNTFISSSLSYISRLDYQQVGISIDRPFYSPLAKWAGGISGVKIWTRYNYLNSDSLLQKIPLEFFNSDYWVARSFNPQKNNTIDNRSRNIAVAVRYANTHYQKRPSFEIDSNEANVHSSLYIGSLGYSVRKFYKDKYIYRFGANEDIPEGMLIQGLYGVIDKEQNKFRYYIGFEASYGKHYEKFGYISTSYAYGNFFNKSVKNNATINLGLTYFTNLLKIGRWNFRQFLYYKIIYGINKTPQERILIGSSEMYGFRSKGLEGTRKMIMRFETVMYAPYNIIGFRFAPVLLISLGMIDTEQPRFFYTQIYQSYAAGFLIRNENIIASSLQITVGIYPYTVPGNSTHFRINPIANLTLRVFGFATQKPNTIAYQ